MNPVVIILPEGATIGGVTSWASTLAWILRRAGRGVTVLIHGGVAGHRDVEVSFPPGCVERVGELPAPKEFAGALGSVEAVYGRVADEAAARYGGEALLLPTRDADCFAACARVAQRGGARLVGWRHSPMGYERAIFGLYGPMMSRIIGVSSFLCAEMRSMLPERSGEIGLVHNGVRVPDLIAERSGGLRLIYTGRLDEAVKRVSSLAAMSAALEERGVEHELTIVGDGPAAGMMKERCGKGGRIRLVGAQAPSRVESMLREHDVFVLGSRMEGLSISALEAMAQGCAVVLARTASGADDLVGGGEAGVVVDVESWADGEVAGRALAQGVVEVVGRGVGRVGEGAHARARRLFSLEAMGEALERELELAACGRRADGELARAFHDPERPGSVPDDARERLGRVLREIGDGPIVVHGLGGHTRALAEVMSSWGEVVGFADDEPGRWGMDFLGVPVVSPERAGRTGARDVVISSWLHEPEIWARRGVYERQGMRVHRLYGVGTLSV